MSERIRLLQDYLLSHNPSRFFADDATLEEVLGGRIWQGWEAIDAWHRSASPEALFEGQAELVRLIEGDNVVAAELLVGVSDPARGSRRLPMVAIYDITGRTIRRARLYFEATRDGSRTSPGPGTEPR